MNFKFLLAALILSISVTVGTVHPAFATDKKDDCEKRLVAEPTPKPDTLITRLWSALFSSGKSPKTEEVRRVYAIELTNIKALNDLHLGVSTTEKLLGSADDAIHEMLEGSDLGKIVGSNYKTFYVESKLNETDFIENIVIPLRNILAGWYDKIQPSRRRSFESQSWREWVNASLKLGVGKDIPESTIDVHLRRLAEETGETMSIAEWLENLRFIRSNLRHQRSVTDEVWRQNIATLRSITKLPGVSKEDVILKLAQTLGDEVNPSEIDYGYAMGLARYYNLLKQADLLPVFKGVHDDLRSGGSEAIDDENLEMLPWRVRREWITQKASPHAKYVFASDGVGFGTVALWAMDNWVSDGADLDRLESSLAKVPESLAQAHVILFKVIRDHLYPAQQSETLMYRSGDDALFFLPQLNQHQLESLNKNLKRLQSELHDDRFSLAVGRMIVTVRFRFSSIVMIKDSMEDAIEEARHQVK